MCSKQEKRTHPDDPVVTTARQIVHHMPSVASICQTAEACEMCLALTLHVGTILTMIVGLVQGAMDRDVCMHMYVAQV